MLPSGSEPSALANSLISAANAGGGWGYYPGKASRIESTAWALLALSGHDGGSDLSNWAAHREFLTSCQRADGWLVEHSEWPVNIAFNAMVSFVWVTRPQLAAKEQVQRLVASVARTKGVQVPPSPSFAQDNSLQGWSWTADTFSWVEPTAWGTFALKKALRAGFGADVAAPSRIQEADRLLFDRCCHTGGWNFGNANVMGRDLYAHIPPTALALIALQDRRDELAVTRSLEFLESHWAEEPSLLALGLSLICLRVYGRPVGDLEDRLRARVAESSRAHQSSTGSTFSPAPSESLHGCAVALTALTFSDHEAAFRI